MSALALSSASPDRSSPPSPLRVLWRASPPLVASAVALGALAAVCLVGLAVDPRTLAGEPIWVKPLKFCVSGALYVLALAVLIRPLRGRWTRRAIAWGVATILAGETALVALQALRGVRSHFNVATPFDAALYSAMGLGISVVWALTLVAAVAVLRTPSADALWKRATVWALALALAGGSVGVLMTSPTAAQLDAFASGTGTVAGAHAVGAPDGGPGLPVVGWSTVAGDLRVPHFWGLHGLQALPLLALWLRRRRLSERQRGRLLTAGGVAYGGVLAVLLAQALGGEPLVAPGAATLAALVGLVAVTTFTVCLILRRP